MFWGRRCLWSGEHSCFVGGLDQVTEQVVREAAHLSSWRCRDEERRAARGAVLAVVLSEAPLVGYSVVVLGDADHEEFRLDLELLSMKPGCGTWQSPE